MPQEAMLRSDTDDLLDQALALVNEDKRGSLIDIIEQIITQSWVKPQTVYVLAVGTSLEDIVGVYPDLDTLTAAARRLGLRYYSVGELTVQKRRE